MSLGVGAAGAATPAVKGCVGASVSAAADAFHPYGRNFVSTITPRNEFGSLADGLHALQAGDVDDALYPNTCNG
jgi:hypothetical protein